MAVAVPLPLGKSPRPSGPAIEHDLAFPRRVADKAPPKQSPTYFIIEFCLRWHAP